MGYRGKWAERARARELRAGGLTMPEIADRLGVSLSSVSLWVRDVPFEPSPGRTGARRRGPSARQRRKQAEIEELIEAGRERVGRLSEREFLMAGLALYAGEGSKTDGEVSLANTNPRIVAFFCHWLRTCFAIEEERLRCRLYLHQGHNLAVATRFWSQVTGVPSDRFHVPYRAVADATIRRNEHPMGCLTVRYCSARLHREIIGLMSGLLASAVTDCPDGAAGSGC